MTAPDKERVLEQKAKVILEHLKSNLRYDQGFLPRPFMIELSGSPSSGKSTTIKELDDFLRPLGFTVWTPDEAAREIRHIPRTTPIYNIRTAISALTKLVDESYGHKYDIILFDRCIFDAYCWMEYWAEKEKLTPGDKFIIQSFFTLPFFTERVDLYYFMVCDSKVAMERELRIALSKRPRETTNPASIDNKVTIWKRAYGILHSFHPNIRLVDTTHLNEAEMVENIAMDILNVLEAKSKKDP